LAEGCRRIVRARQFPYVMVQEPPTREIQVRENTHPIGIEQLVVGRCLLVSEKREGARFIGR
jgi:hypothetical protein